MVLTIVGRHQEANYGLYRHAMGDQQILVETKSAYFSPPVRCACHGNLSIMPTSGLVIETYACGKRHKPIS